MPSVENPYKPNISLQISFLWPTHNTRSLRRSPTVLILPIVGMINRPKKQLDQPKLGSQVNRRMTLRHLRRLIFIIYRPKLAQALKMHSREAPTTRAIHQVANGRIFVHASQKHPCFLVVANLRNLKRHSASAILAP